MGLLDYTAGVGQAGKDTANIMGTWQQTQEREAKLPGELQAQEIRRLHCVVPAGRCVGGLRRV